jgi:hypothetical protein
MSAATGKLSFTVFLEAIDQLMQLLPACVRAFEHGISCMVRKLHRIDGVCIES